MKPRGIVDFERRFRLVEWGKVKCTRKRSISLQWPSFYVEMPGL